MGLAGHVWARWAGMGLQGWHGLAGLGGWLGKGCAGIDFIHTKNSFTFKTKKSWTYTQDFYPEFNVYKPTAGLVWAGLVGLGWLDWAE